MFLREKGYKYIEKNIQTNQNTQREMMNMGLMSVPAFLIGDNTVLGLDKKKIEELIDYTICQCPNCGQKIRIPMGKGKIKITCNSCKEEFEKIT